MFVERLGDLSSLCHLLVLLFLTSIMYWDTALGTVNTSSFLAVELYIMSINQFWWMRKLKSEQTRCILLANKW